jgi:hypothetical protein
MCEVRRDDEADMTRVEAERTLFENSPTADRQRGLKRRRVEATYCPRCDGWVEVRLQPVRLRCVGCGLEARP